jgi:hypothetical protein
MNRVLMLTSANYDQSVQPESVSFTELVMNEPAQDRPLIITIHAGDRFESLRYNRAR